MSIHDHIEPVAATMLTEEANTFGRLDSEKLGSIALCSIAASLKRMADAYERTARLLEKGSGHE